MINIISQFVLIGSALSMLISGIWMALGSSDHPNSLPGIIMLCSVLLLFVSMGIVIGGIGKDIQYWPTRAKDISENYRGQLNFIERVLDRTSYSVDFNYRGKKFEYLDTFKVFYNSNNGRTYATQKELLFRTPVTNGFMLDMSISAGESVIGKTINKIDGLILETRLRDISQNPSLSLFKGLNIYSDQEDKAVRFLSDNDVQKVYLKYKQNNSGSCMSFPLKVKDGFVSFLFQDADGGLSQDFKKGDNLDPYLDDLVLLSTKLV